MNYEFDIISIGDATLDTFLMLDEANVLCSLNKEECWLCLDYASKIPVKEVHRAIAGNAANNAVGSARLGLKAGLYTIVGNDTTGEMLTDTLKKEKVSNKYVEVVKGKASNFSVVLNFKAERTILVYHEKRQYKLPKLGSSRWVYFTSMGQGSESIHPALVAHIKKTGAKLAFNPGTYQLKSGLKALQPILKVTTVLILNKEEGWQLVGHPDTNGTEGIKEVMKKLWSLGPQTVVLTDGANGSYAFDGKNYHFMDIFPAEVISKTGAGDSFSTGFLAAMILGHNQDEALRWGTFNSASVIQKIGPQAGLLYKKDMLKLAKDNPRFKCKQI